MLNKYKIGTKLTVGFLIVLALLLAVGITGLIGMRTSRKSTNEVLGLEDLQTDIMLIRRNLVEAQLATTFGSWTGNEEHKKKREEVSAEINKTADEIKVKLVGENPERLKKLREAYARFETNDNKWYENNAERKIAHGKLGHAAENVLKALQGIRVFIEDVTHKEGEANKNADGEPCLRAMRLKQLDIVDACRSTMQEIRRVYYDYCYQTDLKLSAERLDRINKELIPQLEKELGKTDPKQGLRSILTMDDAFKLLDQADKELDAWKADLKEVTDIAAESDLIDVDNDKIFGEIETLIVDMRGAIGTRVTEIRASAEQTDTMLMTTIAVVGGVALLCGLLISFFLSRNITTGINAAVFGLTTIAQKGDVSFEIPAEMLNRKDEVGELAKSANFILNDYRTIGTMAESLAAGDWRVTVKEKGELDAMNKNLGQMLTQVNEALHEISESVRQVNTGAGEVSSASQTLSSGAQESAASLEEITASMSEISSQTKANAQSATEARDLAQRASQAAGQGQDAMKEMNNAMERITKNSSEIQRVIKVIDDIAFQTNLLALNAAVEAARAGVHGKGFAVVAEEVRNLAARSAKAAQETTELISTSGMEINRGGEVATHTAEVLNEIVEQIKQTTDLVAGIAVASNEQAQGVAQVTVGLQQIDAVTQQNTAAAEESASAANEMSGMATNLQGLVAKFQLRP